MSIITEGFLDRVKRSAAGLAAGVALSVATPSDAAPIKTQKTEIATKASPQTLNMVALPIDIKVLFEQLKLDEGVSKTVYVCPAGYKTVGVGFNLQSDPKLSRKLITGFGIDYDAFIRIPDGKKTGTIALSDEQIKKLFELSVAESIKDVKATYPNFDYQPPAIKMVLINMRFNLGKGGLAGFKKFNHHINSGLNAVVRGMGPPKNFAAFAEATKHYQDAAKEMESSQWWGQVGDRAKRLQKMVLGASSIKDNFFYRKNKN